MLKGILEVGDELAVRPMGSLNSVWGTFISKENGTITIKKENGEIKTITYGNFF